MTSDISLGTVPSAGASTSTTSAEQSNELGQDAFLELLITQIQNQNPLDPSDPSEFLSQLASFSSLEQMGAIGDGIESLAVLQATGLSLQNVELVGKTVVYESNTGPVQDGQATFRIQTTAPAERVVIEYKDGGVTKTKEIRGLQQGTHEIELDDLEGPTVTIDNIAAYNGDEPVDMSVSVYSVATVDGVTFEGGSPNLMLGTLLKIQPADVIEVLR